MRQQPVTQSPPLHESAPASAGHDAEDSSARRHDEDDTRIVFGSWDAPLVPSR